MNEKRFIGLVVGVGVGLAVITIVGIVISKNARAAAREKNLATLAAKLGDAVSKSNEYIRDQDFEQATMTLQAIEPSIMTVGNNSLKTQWDQALGRVADAERDYKAKLEKGWTVFEGKFVSPEGKQRILADRKQKREEDLRQAEHERQLADARRQKDMAERQRREEQRRAEQRRLAEQRKADEAAERRLTQLQPISVEVLKVGRSAGPSHTQVDLRITNTTNQYLKHVSVKVELRDSDGTYLGFGSAMASGLRPGAAEIVDATVLDVPARVVGQYTITLDAVVNQDGLRADGEFQLVLVSDGD